MKTKKSGSQETAFYSKQVNTRCNGCGKLGLRKEDCWELESNKDKTPKNWRSNDKDESGNRHNKNPNIVCWQCNKKGHVQSICLENKEQESGMTAFQEEEASDTEVSFMAMSGTEKNRICGLEILELQHTLQTLLMDYSIYRKRKRQLRLEMVKN